MAFRVVAIRRHPAGAQWQMHFLVLGTFVDVLVRGVGREKQMLPINPRVFSRGVAVTVAPVAH